MAKRILKEAIDRFYDYGIMVNTRTLYLGANEEDGSDTNYKTAERMIKGLHLLDNMGDSPITILMNNEGGEEVHGMAIYDAIKNCSCEVRIIVYGTSMSMGSIILQAADQRIMAPNSSCMIHHGTWEIRESHPKIAKNWLKEEDRFTKWMVNLYLEKIREKHPEYTYADVDKLLNFDTILSARETVDLGLADEVLE